MDRVAKYTQYFTAQADGKIPRQRGGMLGGVLTLDNALNWVNKFCDIATDTVQVISPIKQVADRVKSELLNGVDNTIKQPQVPKKPHKLKRSRKKQSDKTQAHKLVKRFKKK